MVLRSSEHRFRFIASGGMRGSFNELYITNESHIFWDWDCVLAVSSAGERSSFFFPIPRADNVCICRLESSGPGHEGGRSRTAQGPAFADPYARMIQWSVDSRDSSRDAEELCYAVKRFSDIEQGVATLCVVRNPSSYLIPHHQRLLCQGWFDIRVHDVMSNWYHINMEQKR